jgi:hypothetical protein
VTITGANTHFTNGSIIDLGAGITAPSRGDPIHFRLSLACIRRFQLRARLGPSWRIGDSPLTDPAVQISRSGFFKRDSPLPPRSG